MLAASYEASKSLLETKGKLGILAKTVYLEKKLCVASIPLMMFDLTERCNLECGPHGSCESGRCVCDPGWQGDVCSVKTCDPRCSAHGMCSNGTCLCTNGKK